MMTQDLGFSVLSAPLAAIDRRSLSQAWYSALHLAKDRAVSNDAARPQPPPRRPGAAHACIRPEERPAEHRLAQTRQRAKQNERIHRPPLERRALRSALARRIEEQFLNPRRPLERASFTIDGTNARVHVTLQREGARMRLIAVCAPSVRAVVARALEEARYALAEAGIALRVEARER